MLAVGIYGLFAAVQVIKLGLLLFFFVEMLKPNAKLPKMLFLMPGKHLFLFIIFCTKLYFYLNASRDGAPILVLQFG
jgi:hypothetical protein